MDFNACRSVVVAGNSGKYILKPVLNLTDDEESGSISGSLPPAEASAVVMAEDSQGHILKTTVAAAASGNSGAASFTLSQLPASSKGYDVVITPPAPSDAGRPNPNFRPLRRPLPATRQAARTSHKLQVRRPSPSAPTTLRAPLAAR